MHSLRTVATALFATAPLSAGSASPPSPSTATYSNYCLGSAFVTCASVQIVAIPNGSGGTTVGIRTRVLNDGFIGFMAFGSRTAGPGLDPIAQFDRGRSYGTQGAVNGRPDATDDGWDTDRFEWFPAIYGCDTGGVDLNDTNGPGGFQTCDRLGSTGWVVFRLDFSTVLDPKSLFVQWESDAGVSGECLLSQRDPHPGVGCVAGSFTAAPEPASWVLVGTGVVGVILARRLRSRRRPDLPGIVA
jgi:hypothetical protein